MKKLGDLCWKFHGLVGFLRPQSCSVAAKSTSSPGSSRFSIWRRLTAKSTQQVAWISAVSSGRSLPREWATRGDGWNSGYPTSSEPAILNSRTARNAGLWEKPPTDIMRGHQGSIKKFRHNRLWRNLFVTSKKPWKYSPKPLKIPPIL